MTARSITVEFIGKDKSLSKTANDVEGKTSRLGDQLSKVGKVAGAALAGGAILAGKALFDMTKNAIEDEAAQRKLAIALRNSVGATDAQVAGVEKWISTQGRALGVTDDELRPAFQRLVEATGSIGEAQRQMGIAMDVSAGTGKSLKTVTEALMKANNGTTASLSKLGLKTKDAQGNTLSLDDALKSMANTFEGQAAAKANTLEGKMARLQLIFDEAKETIGSKLIPVVTKLADWFLKEGVPAIERFSKSLDETLGPIVKALAPIIKGAFKVIAGIFKTFGALLRGDWKGVWNGIKTILKGAAEALKGILRLAFKGLAAIGEAGGRLIIAGIKKIPGGIRALGGLFVDAGSYLIRKFFDGFTKVGAFLSNIVGAIKAAFVDAINWVIGKLNEAIPNSLSIPGAPDINLPNSPIPTVHLARGGVVKARPGGTLAVIGEGGHDEAVIPLSGPNARRAGVGGVTNVYNINVSSLDPRSAGKAVVDALVAWQRGTGQTIPVVTR